MSAENQENRGLPTKKAKFGDGSVGMTEKTARGIRSPLSSSENNIEHVQTVSVADTASSTSNIFNTTEERAMTAEEEEEKTARDRREPTRRRLLRIETLLIGPLARNRIKIPSLRGQSNTVLIKYPSTTQDASEEKSIIQDISSELTGKLVMKSATNSTPPATTSLQHSKELKERPPLSKKIADCPLLKVHEEANHELNNTTDRYQH
ncbi:hypothetical protein B9Z55_027892 [Caenorhabditis nigoni]|uniref:Uncharacterized protein n=1 Tax=Caenorhabditis nigoni TaxID=1611254 RepID=A0A2G5SDT9_9PELO|nr:hypothetical protein B9Z55_027892 [Caenorhabditis nigoni]